MESLKKKKDGTELIFKPVIQEKFPEIKVWLESGPDWSIPRHALVKPLDFKYEKEKIPRHQGKKGHLKSGCH